MEELREAAKTVERGLLLTSSSSSVNLSETIQASVNAAITKMAQLMITHTGDHATVASAPAQDQPRRYTPDQPPQRQTHQPRRYTPDHPPQRQTHKPHKSERDVRKGICFRCGKSCVSRSVYWAKDKYCDRCGK